MGMASEPADFEDPVDIAEAGPAELDDTGIDVSLPEHLPRRRGGGDRIRIGFFSVPSGPFSCAIAVAIHGVGLLAALCATHWMFRPPDLPANWGGGGGGRSITLGDTESQETSTRALPGAGIPAVPPARRVDAPTEEVADVSPFPSERATRFDSSVLEAHDDADQVIGAISTADVAAVPQFRRSEGSLSAAAANSSVTGNSAAQLPGSSASITPADGGGADSHAGLPGALIGKGIPAPDYPIEARRRGEQGVVKVAVEVLPDGSVGEIRVVSEPGFPLLRQAALTATEKLRRFPFTPAHRFGRPVRDFLVIPYHFILQ